MTKETKEKAQEIEQFCRRQAERWYRVAAQLENTIKLMESTNTDYGKAYEQVCDAHHTAKNTASAYWADYKNAAKAAEEGRFTLFNRK